MSVLGFDVFENEMDLLKHSLKTGPSILGMPICWDEKNFFNIQQVYLKI